MVRRISFKWMKFRLVVFISVASVISVLIDVIFTEPKRSRRFERTTP